MRKGKILQCKRCGKEFYRRQSKVKAARFCSRRCANENMIKSHYEQSQLDKSIIFS